MRIFKLCATCVKGNGVIEAIEIKQGDSFFVPVNYGRYYLKGDLEIIIAKV